MGPVLPFCYARMLFERVRAEVEEAGVVRLRGNKDARRCRAANWPSLHPAEGREMQPSVTRFVFDSARAGGSKVRACGAIFYPRPKGRGFHRASLREAGNEDGSKLIDPMSLRDMGHPA